MKNAFRILSATLMLSGACSSADATGAGSGTGGSTPAAQDVRGARYCEILMGFQQGTSVRIDVYNTYGLNDCPEAAWGAVDPAQVQAQLHADSVTLNGPRRWVIDAFANSAFLDPTVVTLGGIEMRKAGELDLPLAEAASAGAPYVIHAIMRDTTYVFQAGKMVYELVDPVGRVFDMQSFSLAQGDLTEAELSGLGGKLSLPAGWAFRARRLAQDLEVTAVQGVATIVRDDLANTYQLSAP
jgi:hypothetical protein